MKAVLKVNISASQQRTVGSVQIGLQSLTAARRQKAQLVAGSRVVLVLMALWLPLMVIFGLVRQ